MIEHFLTGDEVLKDFLFDTAGRLQDLERDLAALHTDRAHPEVLRRIIQSLHHIHRLSDLLGLTPWAELTQSTTALLQRGRPDGLPSADRLPDEVFKAVALMHDWLGPARGGSRPTAQPCKRLVGEPVP